MRKFIAVLMLIGLAACGEKDLDKPPVPLGDFALGHNIVVAPKPVKGPASRDATPEVLSEAMKKALGDRFGRYEGDALYHFGVSVDGYVLAIPGIPLVYTPKSAFIIQITVWDDARGVKLNEEPKQIIVSESISAKTFIGSGNTQTGDEQLANLTAVSAKQVERWLVERHKEDGWFTDNPRILRAKDDGTKAGAEDVAKTLENATGDAATDASQPLTIDTPSDPPVE